MEVGGDDLLAPEGADDSANAEEGSEGEFGVFLVEFDRISGGEINLEIHSRSGG